MTRRRRHYQSNRNRYRHRPFDWDSLHLSRAPYRSPNGRILGVCSGLAEHFDLSVKGVRIVAVLLLICSGFWPVLALYLLAAVLMKPARQFSQFPGRRTFGGPEDEHARGRYGDPSRDEWDYRSERKSAVESLKRTFDRLSRRLQSLEDAVTAKEFDWDRRFRQS